MNKHIVLVHGAWQGAWAFDAWRPYLEASGWTVHAVDLPGNTWNQADPQHANITTYSSKVIGLIEQIGEPVVLLGHSGGGLTISQTAQRIPERIKCLVYLAGMMLPSGMAFRELVNLCREEQPTCDFNGITPSLEYDENGASSVVPVEAALDVFFHDCEPAAALKAASLLRPQPESGREMTPSLTPDRFAKVARVYIEAVADRSISIYLQRRMQMLSPGAVTRTLQCGHVPQLAAPQALTETLNDAVSPFLSSNT